MDEKTDFHQIVVAEREVGAEIRGAIERFPAMRSPHEGYAILLEELDELKEVVFWGHKKRSPDQYAAAMRAECKQVAAMALRFMADLT